MLVVIELATQCNQSIACLHKCLVESPPVAAYIVLCMCRGAPRGHETFGGCHSACCSISQAYVQLTMLKKPRQRPDASCKDAREIAAQCEAMLCGKHAPDVCVYQKDSCYLFERLSIFVPSEES